jgi:hypothetical protein
MAEHIDGYSALIAGTQGYADMTLMRDNADKTRSGFPLRMTQGSDEVWRISEM